MHRSALPVIGLFAATLLTSHADDPLAPGDTARAHHNYPAALTAYTQAIAQNPRDPRAYLLRGMVRAKLGDNPGAIADDTAALALDPKSAVALTNRANARAATGDLDGARADYTRALDLDPGHAMAFLNRANVEAMQKNYAAALPDYNAALALQPGNTLALYDRAGARRAVGKYAGAVADYSQVLLRDPQDVRARINRAVLRMAQRKWTSATADLRHTLTLLAPDRQIYPRLYLWVIGVRQGQAATATADLQRYARQCSPAYSGTWPAKLESFCLGQLSEPQLLLDAIALQPKKGPTPFSQACYFAGLQRATNHDAPTAARLFQKSVAQGDPKLHEVILAREELKAEAPAP